MGGGVRSGSCSTGEDGKGETRPKLRGERGMWPKSPWMADGGGNGGRSPAGSRASRSPSVDRRHRGRGWWRRERGTRAWTRGTGQKRGTAVADAFYGVLRARHRGKGQTGSGVWRRVEGKTGKRGGGGSGGQLGRLASALDRWVWVAPLPRDKGGRRGASDAGASVCHVGPGDVGARWQ
jgi:hypothetical protein